MKVGINVSFLNSMNKGRGIGFYTEYLVESLKKYTDFEVVTIESHEAKPKVDLIHYPFFDFFRPTLKIDKKIPTVVTIHDVIPLLFPKVYPAGIRGKINLFRQKQALKKVDAVITDSHTSTQDVLKVFKLPKDDVFTVYLAQAEHFKKLSQMEVKKTLAKFSLPEKFVLYTGGVNWNKNILGQTEAALAAGVDIVFAGKGFETKTNLDHPELRNFAAFLAKYQNNPKVHILGFVSDQEVVALMNAALTVLFVSFYEGFGLPILEAQACGVPVITGNNSSMQEVVGEKGIRVDAQEISDISQEIKKMEDYAYRQKIIEYGLQNIKRFSWEITAQETVKVYEYALSKK